MAIVNGLSDVARRLEDVTYPDPQGNSIAGLETYENAFQYQAFQEGGPSCLRVFRTIAAIQDYCKKEHDWINTRKRGGDVRHQQQQPSNALWREGVRCQEFFRFKPWSRLFTVDQGLDEGETHGDSRVEEILQRGKAMLTQHRRALEAY